MPCPAACLLLVLAPAVGHTQNGPPMEAVSLRRAVDAALTRGLHVALARTDSATTRAQLAVARELPNPVATANWTEDAPHLHAFLQFPIDYPWYRRARVRSADFGARSASYRLAFERAAARFDAETTYVRALAAAEQGQLSRLNAATDDSLRRAALVRRDAGDASDLDVELATITAGQSANTAAIDSVAAVNTLLDLQLLMGMAADSVQISLADSLTPSLIPVSADRTDSGTAAAALQVAAASEALAAAEQAYARARRGAFAQPSVSVGVEGGDPTQKHLLPAAGVAIPLPLFNRNGGAAAVEAAGVDRARAQLAAARRENSAAIAQARRAMAAASTRVQRDQQLLGAAHRVAAMSLTAFAEGAQGLSAVLEAQRGARAARVRYVEDVAAVNAASAALQLFTATVSAP
jgi:outer membrane protein, heavy metal efflux system